MVVVVVVLVVEVVEGGWIISEVAERAKLPSVPRHVGR